MDQHVERGSIVERVVRAQDEVLRADDVRAAGREAGDAPAVLGVLRVQYARTSQGPTASSSSTPSKSSSPMWRCADASSMLIVSGWDAVGMGRSWLVVGVPLRATRPSLILAPAYARPGQSAGFRASPLALDR